MFGERNIQMACRAQYERVLSFGETRRIIQKCGCIPDPGGSVPKSSIIISREDRKDHPQESGWRNEPEPQLTGLIEGIKGGLDLLLPRRCAHCARLLKVPGPLCLLCFRLLESCRIPNWELPGFTPAGRSIRAVSYYRRGSPLRGVHRMAKYGKSEACAEWLGGYAARRLAGPEMNSSCLIQRVPSHPARLLERGVDVVGIMAGSLARRFGGTSVELLRRTRLGTPQNHLDRDGRIDNVREAFEAGSETIAMGPCHITLFDDVVTTGATLDACADILEACGHTVSLLSLALRRELFMLPRTSESRPLIPNQR